MLAVSSQTEPVSNHYIMETFPIVTREDIENAVETIKKCGNMLAISHYRQEL